MSAGRSASWNAVYGAFVSQQVWDRMERGLGPPEEAEYEGIVEDAACVADLAEAKLQELLKRER